MPIAFAASAGGRWRHADGVVVEAALIANTWLALKRNLRFSTNRGIMTRNTTVILAKLRRNPPGVRFSELAKVCDAYFGEPRQRGSGHRVYRTPWQGDPRVNIQNAKGMAKPYQVRQVLKAIERLGRERGE